MTARCAAASGPSASGTAASGLTNQVVRYVYDGNLVIQERDANNLPLVTYTRGKDLSGSLRRRGGIGGLLGPYGQWSIYY